MDSIAKNDGRTPCRGVLSGRKKRPISWRGRGQRGNVRLRERLAAPGGNPALAMERLAPPGVVEYQHELGAARNPICKCLLTNVLRHKPNENCGIQGQSPALRDLFRMVAGRETSCRNKYNRLHGIRLYMAMRATAGRKLGLATGKAGQKEWSVVTKGSGLVKDWLVPPGTNVRVGSSEPGAWSFG